MRITFFAPRYHTNQIPVVEGLLAAGHMVQYLVLHKGQSEDYSALIPKFIPMNWFWKVCLTIRPTLDDPMLRMKWGVPMLRLLWKEVKRFSPDQVVFRGDPIRTLPNLFLWVICLVRRIPVIIYTQDPVCGGNPSKGRLLSYWLFLKVLKYPWYSPVIGKSQEYSARKGITYLPFVQNPCVSTSAAGTHGAVPRILTIGKMFPRKNHRLLVQSLASLRSEFEFRLTIIGEASCSAHREELIRLKSCIAETNMEDIVEIRLNLGVQDVHACYDQADLFVLTSTNESASISNLEAMGHGLPVICSNTNGTAAYTKEGFSGYLFKDNDMDDLTSTLRKALSSLPGLHVMGTNALELVRTHHSPTSFSKSFERLCT